MVPPLDRTWMIGIWPVDVYQIPIIIGISSGVLLLLLFIAVLVAWRCCHFQRLREKAFGTKLVYIFLSTDWLNSLCWLDIFNFSFFFFCCLAINASEGRTPVIHSPSTGRWGSYIVPFQLIKNRNKTNRENLLEIFQMFTSYPSVLAMSMSPSKPASPSLTTARNQLASNSCELVRLTTETPTTTMVGIFSFGRHLIKSLSICEAFGMLLWLRRVQWRRPTLSKGKTRSIRRQLSATVARTCRWWAAATTSPSTSPASTKNP